MTTFTEVLREARSALTGENLAAALALAAFCTVAYILASTLG